MGDNSTDDLQEREDALAREYASEDGGFGRSELTDIDERFSRDFTDGGADTSAWNMTGNNNAETDNEQNNERDAMPGASMSTSQSIQNYDGGGENWNGEGGNFDGQPSVENGSRDDGKSSGDKSDNQQNEKQDQAQNGSDDKREKGHARIPWKSGDKIDLKLLTLVWDEIHKIKEVEPLINTANESLKELLLTMPNSMILTYVKAHNNFRQWSGKHQSDLIGTILDMANSFGKRMTYTAVSTFGAIFSQTWTDPLLIATMPATIELALSNPIMQGVLEVIFEKAVPILEGMDTHEGKDGQAIKHININY